MTDYQTFLSNFTLMRPVEAAVIYAEDGWADLTNVIRPFFATVRTRLKRMKPFKIICYTLNCLFTGVEYDEVRLSKGRFVT